MQCECYRCLRTLFDSGGIIDVLSVSESVTIFCYLVLNFFSISILVTIFFYFVPTCFSIYISVVILCCFIPNFWPLIAYLNGSKLSYMEYKMTEMPLCTSKYYCLIPLSITLLMIVCFQKHSSYFRHCPFC